MNALPRGWVRSWRSSPIRLTSFRAASSRRSAVISAYSSAFLACDIYNERHKRIAHATVGYLVERFRQFESIRLLKERQGGIGTRGLLKVTIKGVDRYVEHIGNPQKASGSHAVCSRLVLLYLLECEVDCSGKVG